MGELQPTAAQKNSQETVHWFAADRVRPLALLVSRRILEGSQR